MGTVTKQDIMKSVLCSVGLPYIDIQVYGSQITIECKSKITADKWASIVSKFANVKRILETHKENKINKGTCLLPTTHKIYRLYARI